MPLSSISVNQNLAAIGDAEGTVSIMQLCKPLYETTAKEKEVMAQIFDREFKREKNLEIMKKLGAAEGKEVGKSKNHEKQQKEREEKMKAHI